MHITSLHAQLPQYHKSYTSQAFLSSYHSITSHAHHKPSCTATTVSQVMHITSLHAQLPQYHKSYTSQAFLSSYHSITSHAHHKLSCTATTVSQVIHITSLHVQLHVCYKLSMFNGTFLISAKKATTKYFF